VHIIR